MQCTGNCRYFLSPGEKRAAIVTRYPAFRYIFFIPCVRCFRVSIPPAVRPALLRQMDIGSLTCAQIWVRSVHTKGWLGRNKSTSAQELTRRGRKPVLHPAPLGDRTQGLQVKVKGLRVKAKGQGHVLCFVLYVCSLYILSILYIIPCRNRHVTSIEQIP